MKKVKYTNPLHAETKTHSPEQNAAEELLSASAFGFTVTQRFSGMATLETKARDTRFDLSIVTKI